MPRLAPASKVSPEEYHAAADRALDALTDYLELLTEEHPGANMEREAEYSVSRCFVSRRARFLELSLPHGLSLGPPTALTPRARSLAC
jgi:hypothetical protein